MLQMKSCTLVKKDEFSGYTWWHLHSKTFPANQRCEWKPYLNSQTSQPFRVCTLWVKERNRKIPCRNTQASLAKPSFLQFTLRKNAVRIVSLAVVWSGHNYVFVFFTVCMVKIYSLILAFLRAGGELIFVNISTENWEINRRSPSTGNPTSLLVGK